MRFRRLLDSYFVKLPLSLAATSLRAYGFPYSRHLRSRLLSGKTSCRRVGNRPMRWTLRSAASAPNFQLDLG